MCTVKGSEANRSGTDPEAETENDIVVPSVITPSLTFRQTWQAIRLHTMRFDKTIVER